MTLNLTMKRVLLRSAVVVVVAAGLSACLGGDDDDGGTVITPPPPPPPSSNLEDQFGAQFGIAFRAAANSDPRDPAPGDLVPVSFTTDPVNIP